MFGAQPPIWEHFMAKKTTKLLLLLIGGIGIFFVSLILKVKFTGMMKLTPV